jgi:hypothetical protein
VYCTGHSWSGENGEQPIIPKDEDYGLMASTIDWELAHDRSVRPSRAFLAASGVEVWNDLTIRVSLDSDCVSCRIFIESSFMDPHFCTPY